MQLDNKKDIEFEVLIATMNRTSLYFLNPMFANNVLENYSILIVNQSHENTQLFSNQPNIRVINSSDKGISNSRNLAVKNAFGKIVLFADDDVVYQENFQKTIIESHRR